MSILLLSEIFPPKHGGSGRWFFELYSRLTPGTVTIVTHRNGTGDSDVDANFPQPIVRLPMTSQSWGLLSLSGLKFYITTLINVWRHKPRSLTQIHCGRSLPEGLLGLALAKLLRKPLVCYVHGEDIEVARTSRELTWIVRRVLRGAERLICNSQNTKSLLIEHWQVPTSKIEVINPGVDEQTFRPADPDSEFRARYGWSDRFVCLTVGRLQRRKGHDRMIEAIPGLLEEIPNVLYAIVGQGGNYLNLVAEVERNGVGEQVQFLDEIEDSDLIRCYQQCDLFILPNRLDGSDIEGFGMVLVEAQSVGKPVIAGDSGGTAETMKIGTTGVIADCTNPDYIIDAIRTVREKMGEGSFQPETCRQHVLENLTWQKHTELAREVFGKFGVAR